MLHPNISSLDILKAQRAKKAAAKMAIDSESVTESETEPEIQPPAPVNPLPPAVLLFILFHISLSFRLYLLSLLCCMHKHLSLFTLTRI